MANRLTAFFDRGDAALIAEAGEALELIRIPGGNGTPEAFSGVVSTIPIYQEGAVNGPRVIYDLHIMAPGAAFDNPPRSGDRVRYHGEVYRVTKVQHGGIARAWHLDCNPIK